jgi:uncharacterized protein with NRDE domain
LVGDVLKSPDTTEEGLIQLQREGRRYNGFNLMLSDGRSLGVHESMTGSGRLLAPGIYGLSNHLLDTPWPKVRRAKTRLQAALADPGDTAPMLELLRDDRPANDEELPRTGVDLNWERLLSSAFIRGSEYGTRCSTVIRIHRGGAVSFDEWSWDRSGDLAGHATFQFEVSMA